MNADRIRNFVIIAHIDHGKSTLADRFLEVTETVPMRQMKPQYLDQLELEREKGITIKMTPVRMLYTPPSPISADDNADQRGLIYEDLTYKIRGIIFNVYNKLGPSYKENIYGNALEEEFKKAGLTYDREKIIDIIYDDKKIGVYRPDFVIDNKIILETKAQLFIGKLEIKQIWHYLKGSNYRLALLVNFGSKELQIERIVYDTIRDNPRKSASTPRESAKVEEYVLNLIDTPGHSDFSYEVSRALRAVEGAVLLVDATQGIQAQTLANFEAAKKAGLKIIGCVNKIDLNPPRLEAVVIELAKLIACGPEEIHRVSAKTGQGVAELLSAIVEAVPPPVIGNEDQALIFDSFYDDHKGIVAFVRVFGGSFRARKETKLLAVNEKFLVKETGFFSPAMKAEDEISAGEIGYIATGIKNPGVLKIGDTIGNRPLPGYLEPQPVVFVSLYPEEGDDYDGLKNALDRLRLADAAIKLEPEVSEVLGRGFKAGFLGRLHFEIVIERLRREFGLDTITSFPAVIYRVRTRHGEEIVESPKEFPNENLGASEPMARLKIIVPQEYLGKVLGLKEIFRFSDISTENIDSHVIVSLKMPLSELISDFDDKLKSLTLGYGSFSYEIIGYEPANLIKLEVLVAGEVVPGLTRIVFRPEAGRIARKVAENLKKLLPKKLFVQAIQVSALGKIIARETIPALKKDVTGHLYGGDRSRKMKLWKKQKRGKAKLKESGRVSIPPEIFKELLKK